MKLIFLVFPLLLVGFIAWVFVVEMTLSTWFWSLGKTDETEDKAAASPGFQRVLAIALLAGFVGYLLLGGGEELAENFRTLVDSLPASSR